MLPVRHQNWNRVVFFNESRFTFSCADGRLRIYHQKKKALQTTVFLNATGLMAAAWWSREPQLPFFALFMLQYIRSNIFWKHLMYLLQNKIAELCKDALRFSYDEANYHLWRQTYVYILISGNDNLSQHLPLPSLYLCIFEWIGDWWMDRQTEWQTGRV